MKIRLPICVLALLFAFPTFASAATKIDDPAKFVTGIYKQLAAASVNKPYNPPEDIYTPRLASLWALEKKEAGGEVGRVDFDFWSGAQDWQLTNVKVTEQPVEGSDARKVVIAKFKNTGKSEEMHFYFEKSGNSWLLDDARSMKDETWTLSLILKYGWDSGN